MKVLWNLLTKKHTRVDENHSGHSKKMRGESDLSNTYSEMTKSAGKRRKRYAYHMKDRSKLTCLIHGPGNSSDECKVLGYLSSKCSKTRTTEYRGKEPAKMRKIN